MTGMKFASVFDKVASEGNWRTIRERVNVVISVKDEGCHFEQNANSTIPVTKVELLFDPKYKMSSIISAVQNEN